MTPSTKERLALAWFVLIPFAALAVGFEVAFWVAWVSVLAAVVVVVRTWAERDRLRGELDDAKGRLRGMERWLVEAAHLAHVPPPSRKVFWVMAPARHLRREDLS